MTSPEAKLEIFHQLLIDIRHFTRAEFHDYGEYHLMGNETIQKALDLYEAELDMPEPAKRCIDPECSGSTHAVIEWQGGDGRSSHTKDYVVRCNTCSWQSPRAYTEIDAWTEWNKLSTITRSSDD